jgi:selenocysteine lyase/cysteine desulfurase
MSTPLPSPPCPLSCRHHFPALGRKDQSGISVFADNSSRAQMPAETLRAVENQMLIGETHRGGNGAWDSHRAEAMWRLRTRARQVAAEFCDGEAAQIGFAANGSSAAAILARAMLNNVVSPGDTLVITEADHDANREPWQWLERHGCQLIDVPIAPDGSLDTRAWQMALEAKPRVVALCMASNITGVVLPFETLTNEAHQAGALVVLDAVQGPPHGLATIMSAGVDIAFFSNCKLFAPHLGWWAMKEHVAEAMRLNPPTGHHPELEWGTLAHASLAGFVGTHTYFRWLTPTHSVSDALAAVREHEQALAARFLGQIEDAWSDVLLARGTPYPRVPIFSFQVERPNWARLRDAFRDAGIEIRIGQFGSSATLNRLVGTENSAALRISFVHYNTGEDIDAVCGVLNELQP